MTTYRNSPLDFMLNESKSSDALFGDSDINEVLLPDVEFGEFDELGETPEHEASETPDEETTEELDSLSKELEELKNKISELKVKYPEDTNDEVASALDDATSAIDLAVHHLGDINEDLDKDSNEEPIGDVDVDGSAALENELPVLPPEGLE